MRTALAASGDAHHVKAVASLQERLVLVDWSEVGPWEPMTDLAQVRPRSCLLTTRCEHSRRLVHAYWMQLLASDCTSAAEFPLEACWEGFCRGGGERWVWLLAVMSALPLPLAALQYFHDQLLALVEAHGDPPFYQLKPVVCLL